MGKHWRVVLLVYASGLDWGSTYYALMYAGLSEMNMLLPQLWITSPFGLILKLVIPSMVGWKLRDNHRFLCLMTIVYLVAAIWNLAAILKIHDLILREL